MLWCDPSKPDHAADAENVSKFFFCGSECCGVIHQNLIMLPMQRMGLMGNVIEVSVLVMNSCIDDIQPLGSGG
jgi:hypothetical protein